jgi:outer membrane protein OmpA-like peptidoglycan-associated protein
MSRIAVNRAAFLGVLVALAGSTGAACHEPEPSSPSVGLTKAVHPPQMPDQGRGASRAEQDQLYSVYVGDALVHSCSGSAPFFQFDSADPKKDQPTMQMLANCMLDGPLKGKTIELVGHTDPRGSADYNDKLGLERAERVQRYLVTHGVDAGRVQVSSVGADEARDTPKDWPKDRRVEIRLGK